MKKHIERALIIFCYTWGESPRYFKYVSRAEPFEYLRKQKYLTIANVQFEVDFFKWGKESDYCFLKPFMNESRVISRMLLTGWDECTGRYIQELLKNFKNNS